MIADYSRLQETLVRQNKTLEDLRKEARLSRSTMDKILRQGVLNPEILAKICAVLKCSTADIFDMVYAPTERSVTKRPSNKYGVVSMFSGAGGMDLGFINAGFDVVWANDFMSEAVESYTQNIGDHIVYGDITRIASDNIPDDIDVLIGGFPCQGFSIANSRRSLTDKRNYLYKEMLRVVADKQPKFFVAENVKGILSMDNGKVFEMIKSDFENLRDKDGNSLGYKVDAQILNSAEFGIPQYRERVIFIGNRLGVENPYPIGTHYTKTPVDGLKPPLTTEQAIGFLSDIPITEHAIHIPREVIERHIRDTHIADAEAFYNLLGIESDYRELVIYNHIAAKNAADTFWGRRFIVEQADVCDYLNMWRKRSDFTIGEISSHFESPYTAGHWFRKDRFGSIPKPEDWWKLKKLLLFDNTFDELVTSMVEKEVRYDQALRIVDWNRPSDTITATTPEIHVNKKRRLSVRECAILQSFPLSYKFTGNLSKMYLQVGNAVPVKMAEAIAVGIKTSIDACGKLQKIG